MNRIERRIPSASYSVALGTGIALGLASWMLGSQNDVIQVSILLSLVLTGVAIALFVDRITQQSLFYVGELIVYSILISLIFSYILGGVPFDTLAIYLIVGISLGALPKLLNFGPLYEYLLTTVALLVGTVLFGVHIWSTIPVTVMLFWRTSAISMILLLVFSLLVSKTKDVTALRIGAEYVLFLTIWTSPIIYYIDNTEATSLSPSILVFIPVASLAYIVGRGLIWKLLDKFWIFPMANRWMLTRRLQYLLKHLSASRLTELENAYEMADRAWRRLALKKTIHTDTLMGWATLIFQSQPLLQVEGLDILAEAANNSNAILRTSILRILQDGVLSGSDPLWRHCLERLIRLDTHIAQDACKERAIVGDTAPIAVYLSKSHEISDYRSSIEMLVNMAQDADFHQRQQIIDLIMPYVDDENLQKSSIALYAMVRLDLVDNIPHLFETSRKDYTPNWQIAMTCNPAVMSRYISERFRSNHNKYRDLVDSITAKKTSWVIPGQRDGYALAIETLCDAFFQGSPQIALSAALILAHNEVDTPWVYLADALIPDHLENLLPLLTEDKSAVREIARKTVMLVVEQHSDLLGRATDMISAAFHHYTKHTSEILLLLQKIDFTRVHIEATSLVGKPLPTIMPAVIALIQHAQDEAIQLLSNTLAYQSPRIIAELLNHERDELSDALVTALNQRYAHQDAKWQAELVKQIITLYQVPQSMAREAAGGQFDLKQVWLYPFVMRPPELTEDVFHLEQMLNEPDDFVTGSSITTWFYHKSNNISHLIIAGHANGSVCREVSAKIVNTILDMKDLEPDDVIVVTGAGFIRSRQKPHPSVSTQINSLLMDADDPLVKLQQELNVFEQQVGLVQAKNVASQHDYDAYCAHIRQSIVEQLHQNGPVMIQSDEQSPQHAVLVPFYQLNDPKLEPLSFELTFEILGGRDFEELLDAHLREMRLELVHDARRRKDVYEDWLQQDERSLAQLIFQMISAFAPHVPPHQLQRIVTEYHKIVLNDQQIIQPQWQWNRDWASQSIPGRERTQRFLNFIRTQLRVSSSTSVWTHSNPEVEATFLKGLEEIQERKFPVRGRRNFVDATVADTNEEGILVSLQELVEWRLPDMLRQDKEWIKRMDEFLRKFDETDPKYEGKRIDAINNAVFIDSLLRGWPPVFIESGIIRERYEVWAAENREKVWRNIHQNLKQHKIDMTPLQSNNVIFAVQRKSTIVKKKSKKKQQDYFQVTPYYLTTLNNLNIFIFQHYGIPSYLNLWQRRKTVELKPPEDVDSNHRWAETVCHLGWDALQSNNISVALQHFKQGLRIHPVFASDYLIKRFWQTTTNPMRIRLNQITELSKAVHNFSDNVIGHSRTLHEFIDLNPNFLADPYLLLAYYEEYKGESIEKLKREIDKLQTEVDDLIDALMADGVLEAGQQKGSYQLNTFNMEARAYALAKMVGDGRAEILPIEDAYSVAKQIYYYVERNPHLLKNTQFKESYELVRNIQTKANESKELIDRLIRELVRENVMFETDVPGQYTLNPMHPEVHIYTRKKRQSDNLLGDSGNAILQDIWSGMYGESEEGFSRISSLDELQNTLPALQKQLTQAHIELWSRFGQGIFDLVDLVMPQRFSQLDRLRKKIETTREMIDNERRAIWDYLHNHPNDWIEKAQAIDSDYVTKVFEYKDHMLTFSQNFRKHVLPLWSIGDASKYLLIQNEINKQIRSGHDRSYIDQLKSGTESEKRDALRAIIESISNIMLGSKLEQRDIERLDNLRKHLESFNVIDHMAYQNILGSIDSVQSHFIKEATRIYREAHTVQEFPEMRRLLSVCLRLQGGYLASLKSMIGLSQSPIICSFVDSTFKVINSEYSLISSVTVDKDKQYILATQIDDTSISLISFDRMSKDNILHLLTELARPEFISRIEETNLAPAYAILLMPIASPPLNKCWSMVLHELEPWLIRTMAYTGAMLDDLEQEVREMLFKQFDHTKVIEQIVVDAELIRNEFLKPFGSECKMAIIKFGSDNTSSD